MALEMLLFRIAVPQHRLAAQEGPRLVYREAKWLWLAAIAFHWSLLVILLRHLRLFVEPVAQAGACCSTAWTASSRLAFLSCTSPTS